MWRGGGGGSSGPSPRPLLHHQAAHVTVSSVDVTQLYGADATDNNSRELHDCCRRGGGRDDSLAEGRGEAGRCPCMLLPGEGREARGCCCCTCDDSHRRLRISGSASPPRLKRVGTMSQIFSQERTDTPGEPVFLNVYGARELIARNEFRQPM